MANPVVLLLEPIAPACAARLRATAEVRMATAWDEAALMQQIADVDGVIVRSKVGLSRRVIEAGRRLKVIGRHGIGVDHIDLAAARERGIVVVNTPEANTQSVAEFTLLLMLAAVRRLRELAAVVHDGRPWREADRLTGGELRGRTLGLVGVGRVGTAVAQIASAGFGMRVLYFDYRGRVLELEPSPLTTITPPTAASFDEVCAQADILSLHLRMCEATRGIISRERLLKMKPGAILINTARGGLVDEAALADALRSGPLAAAGLDVFAHEPLAADSPLLALPNVILTPHAASFTDVGFERMGGVVDDVLRVLHGRKPQWRVD